MSPPLVVAYALAGHMDIDLNEEPLGHDPDGHPVFLKDIWPTHEEVQAVVQSAIESQMYRRSYGAVYQGDQRWSELAVPGGDRFAWQPDSTYIRRPSYFDGMAKEAPDAVAEIRSARAIAVLRDSVTTDHISPAGGIPADSPAGRYLLEQGVAADAFNSYGARRGNHEVMVRGTFANLRIRNQLVPGVEGGVTAHRPSGEILSMYDAARRYQAQGIPLIVLAGRDYGSGSSRDWAAKGPHLQGIRAVIAQSYERIHRSNLIGMGVLPLQFHAQDSVASLGLTGHEVFDIEGLAEWIAGDLPQRRELTVQARQADGNTQRFSTIVRIDTPQELLYYRHGGILQYVLRQLRDA